MPQLRSDPTSSARRFRVVTIEPEDSAIEGEFWVVARAMALLVGGLVFLGWILS